MLPENPQRALKRKTRFPPHPDPTPSAASDPIRPPYDNRRPRPMRMEAASIVPIFRTDTQTRLLACIS